MQSEMPEFDTSVVGAFGTALMRPGTYLGHAREALGIARTLAAYPAGLFDAAVRCGEATGDECHDTPVVLVHGYGHNRSAWVLVERKLRATGFHRVTTLNYNPLRDDVPAIARKLADHVELVRTLAGVEKVHIVGHSLGGIVLRWYVQELGGDRHVATGITVATPHHGTVAALLATPLGLTARQLLPGSSVLRRLRPPAQDDAVRWMSCYSNLDLLVQPCRSAVLENAENVLIKDHGHLSILLSPKLARTIVGLLETPATQSEPVPRAA
jgi:triacylglycerol lipase